MNSRRKGKVGEREFAALLREHGYDARRGQQFSGGTESPDVVCPALAWLHVEVKRVQNLNLADACAQAEGDSGGKPWIVAHRRNHAPWLITMRAEFFFELIRELEPQKNGASRTGDRQEQRLRHLTLTSLSPVEAEREVCGGSPDSPDVVCTALPWLHVEVKRVQNLNLADACAQAEGDSAGKPWIVAHRRNHAPWLITMRAETFFKLLAGTLPPETQTTEQPKQTEQ